jgi:hypothetical protein
MGGKGNQAEAGKENAMAHQGMVGRHGSGINVQECPK